MNDRPGPDDLLETARAVFARELVPAVPEHLRYTALMVGNALGIAERAYALGEAPLRVEWEGLSSLFGEAVPAPGGGALPHVVEHYNRRLVRAIRAGRYDGKGRAAMLEHLRRTTEAKLAVSNPRLLSRRRTEGSGGGR